MKKTKSRENSVTYFIVLMFLNDGWIWTNFPRNSVKGTCLQLFAVWNDSHQRLLQVTTGDQLTAGLELPPVYTLLSPANQSSKVREGKLQLQIVSVLDLIQIRKFILKLTELKMIMEMGKWFCGLNMRIKLKQVHIKLSYHISSRCPAMGRWGWCWWRLSPPPPSESGPVPPKI